MTALPSIGFVGLGKMGKPMAARLTQAGYALTVFDQARPVAEAFAREFGAEAARGPAEVGAATSVVITMLPTSTVVESVVEGPEGLLSRMAPGSTLIEMSSGAPSRTRALAVRVAEAGSSLIDAPVSGGVARATSGALAIMAGGDRAAIERVRPILARMGDSITVTGAVGSAHAMKALNNLASAAGLLVSVETLLIGKKLGLDPALMVDILNASTGMNNSTQKKLKQFVLSRKFDAGFGLDLMVKDLTIALDMAHESATPAPFAALCREMWAAAATTLGSGRDHTEIARFSETLAGVEL